jgi:hypothetical protein
VALAVPGCIIHDVMKRWHGGGDAKIRAWRKILRGGSMTPVTCSFFFFLHLLPASKQFDCHPLKNQPFVSLIFNATITHLTFLVSSLNPIRWR